VGILTVTDRLVSGNRHPSEFIEINGDYVEIDKELIPLIKELNKIGLKTQSCCQGSKTEYASISFELGKSLMLWEVKALPDNLITLTIRWPHKFDFKDYTH